MILSISKSGFLKNGSKQSPLKLIAHTGKRTLRALKMFNDVS